MSELVITISKVFINTGKQQEGKYLGWFEWEWDSSFTLQDTPYRSVYMFHDERTQYLDADEALKEARLFVSKYINKNVTVHYFVNNEDKKKDVILVKPKLADYRSNGELERENPTGNANT